jgi:hypothetical protein
LTPSHERAGIVSNATTVFQNSVAKSQRLHLRQLNEGETKIVSYSLYAVAVGALAALVKTSLLHHDRKSSASAIMATQDHNHSQADVQFKIQLCLREPSQDLGRTFAKSKRNEIDFTLVDDDGHALGPPNGNWSELAGMFKRAFPTSYAVKLSPPYLIIRSESLPPPPWPFTIGRLPLCFTDNEWEDCFDRGVLGRGGKELQMIDLKRGDKLFEDVLEQLLGVFQAPGVKIHEIFCFDCFWRIAIPDATDLRRVPRALGGQACLYEFKSEVLDPDPSALRVRVPQGADFDDLTYITTPDALLRPGIMVTSSLRTITENGEMIDVYKKTTSGILVVNKDGDPFITVATHGFEADGLVYHPNPVTESVIGRIIEHLPGTGISVMKLNPGLRYTNHMFGSEVNPDGIETSGISPGYPPHLRTYDFITMDNPYSGFSEGSVLATGYKIPWRRYVVGNNNSDSEIAG